MQVNPVFNKYETNFISFLTWKAVMALVTAAYCFYEPEVVGQGD